MITWGDWIVLEALRSVVPAPELSDYLKWVVPVGVLRPWFWIEEWRWSEPVWLWTIEDTKNEVFMDWPPLDLARFLLPSSFLAFPVVWFKDWFLFYWFLIEVRKSLYLPIRSPVWIYWFMPSKFPFEVAYFMPNSRSREDCLLFWGAWGGGPLAITSWAPVCIPWVKLKTLFPASLAVVVVNPPRPPARAIPAGVWD